MALLVNPDVICGTAMPKTTRRTGSLSFWLVMSLGESQESLWLASRKRPHLLPNHRRRRTATATARRTAFARCLNAILNNPLPKPYLMATTLQSISLMRSTHYAFQSRGAS
jgi:hypothetical protein